MVEKQKKFVSLAPITGSSLSNMFRFLKGNKVEFKYYPKLIVHLFLIAMIAPFRWLERLRDKKRTEKFKIKEDPVFIVGHWRSGTTFLHNVICEDPQMGYVTLYHAIYPITLFSGKSMVKGMMKILMPKRRAADNMELGTEFPQEEEFALSNIHAQSYYNFWYFPKQWKSIFKKFIAFENASNDAVQQWKLAYKKLIKKALINTNGKRFVSKNPPNTGRIDKILEMFPNARFIHIYRNPVETFVSTKNFIGSTIKPLQLQDISEDELDENILWTFDQLVNRFEKQKQLIPTENLIEIRFEDFEKHPLQGIQEIYEQLDLPGFEKARPHFVKYLSSKKDYKKNEHKIPEELSNRINNRWGFAIKRWKYNTEQSANRKFSNLKIVS